MIVGFALPLEVWQRDRRDYERSAVVVLLDHKTRLETILYGQPEDSGRVARLAVIAGFSSRIHRTLDCDAKAAQAISKDVHVREEICSLVLANSHSAVRDRLQPIPTEINRFDYVGVPSHV